MNDSISELEKIIVKNLQSNASLKNDIATKELEKHDQLKEFALGIIDILDSFERVDEILIEKEFDKNEDSLKVINRYKTIKKKLINLLGKYGISKVEFPDNRLIIGLCEVIETEIDTSKRNDDIISVLRSGYIRGKELIRAAQLIIVKN